MRSRFCINVLMWLFLVMSGWHSTLAFTPPTTMTRVWFLPGAYVRCVSGQSEPDSDGFSPGILVFFPPQDWLTAVVLCSEVMHGPYSGCQKRLHMLLVRPRKAVSMQFNPETAIRATNTQSLSLSWDLCLIKSRLHGSRKYQYPNLWGNWEFQGVRGQRPRKFQRGIGVRGEIHVQIEGNWSTHFICTLEGDAYRIYSCTSQIFWTWKWVQKIDLNLYSGEHKTYLPNHQKLPKFTATSQVIELNK